MSWELGVAWAETIGRLFLPGQSPARLSRVQRASPREPAQVVLVCVQG